MGCSRSYLLPRYGIGPAGITRATRVRSRTLHMGYRRHSYPRCNGEHNATLAPGCACRMLQHQHEQGCDPAYIRRVVDGFDKVWDLVDLNG